MVSFTPKYLKGQIGPDLKICWFVITRVCSFTYTWLVRFFSIIVRWKRQPLILIYNIFVTKMIFFQEWTSKNFLSHMFLVDLVNEHIFKSGLVNFLYWLANETYWKSKLSVSHWSLCSYVYRFDYMFLIFFLITKEFKMYVFLIFFLWIILAKW